MNKLDVCQMENVNGGFFGSCGFAVAGLVAATIFGLASTSTGIGTVGGILGISFAWGGVASNCGLTE